MTEKPTILVTGAAGFIGSHLVERLVAAGWAVVGVDNFCDFYPRAMKAANLAAARAGGGFELVEADIREAEAMHALFRRVRPTAVAHLAAMAGVRPSIERPAQYNDVNVAGTVNLLDAAVTVGVERFLFASSSSVYGNNEKVPFAEADPVDHPISPYAATKKAGELLCHTYSHLYNLPMRCVRLFTVFGPRQRPDLAIGGFMRRLDAGEPIPMFGDGSSSRDYTYVADVVAGILAALDHARQKGGYRVFNLGGDQPITLHKLIESLERVTGRSATIERAGTQPGDVMRTWADLTRSRAELGYAPVTALEAGLARQWAALTQAEAAVEAS